jgi:hypothetical protein
MYDKIVTADTFIMLLLEDLGLWTRGNRSYDALVQPGATSVRRPKLSKLVCKKNTGTAKDSADRKGGKNDTVMVETALDTYAVPFKDEVAAAFESNDEIRQGLVGVASKTMIRQFNTDFIAAGLKTTNKVDAKTSGIIEWADVAALIQSMTELEIPQEDRIIVFPANIQADFLSMDVIKMALSYNAGQLSSGKFTEILGHTFFVSALVPEVAGKKPILGAYAPGIASILSKTGKVKEVYDNDNLQDIIDLLAHAAFDLDDKDFAVKLIPKT